MTQLSPLPSPRLEFCPATLPAAVYTDAEWYGREMASVFAQNWICVGRLADFGRGMMRRVQVGAADVIVCRAAEGGVSQHLSASRLGVVSGGGGAVGQADPLPVSCFCLCGG